MIAKKAKPFYGTEAWKRCRKAVLMRDNYMCRDCMQRFEAGYGVKPRRATMVHHVIPYEERPDLALDINNLVSLCEQCHAKRHPEKYGSHGDEPAADKPRMRIIKV